MSAMKPPEHSIIVSRTLDAPAAEVYRAWTEPEVMVRWMAAKVDADVRVGGRYRTESAPMEDGSCYVHTGEYLELIPDEKIVQTFLGGVGEPDPTAPRAYRNEYLQIDLDPISNGQTRLTLTNGWDGKAMSEEARDATAEAWEGWIRGLAAAFAQNLF